MKPKTISILILALSILALGASLTSCGTTPDQQKVISAVATATAANAYIQASPKFRAEDKAHVALAVEVLSTGKVDTEKLVQLAVARLGDKVPADQKAELAKLITSLQTGQLDRAAILELGKTAAITYAASQGIPPEQVSAALALAELLVPSVES